MDEVVVCQPETGETLEVVDTLVRSAAVDLIVVDSVAALVPRSEIEGEIGMVQVGAHARLMSQALRKINVKTAKAGVTIIFLNRSAARWESSTAREITTGGNALKFYASVRLDIRRKEVLKAQGGIRRRRRQRKVKVAKNKVAPPYKCCWIDMLFGLGISGMGCTLDAADEMGVIDRRGSWYSYEDEKLGQGREKAMEFLRENVAVLERVEADVRRVIAERLAGKYGSPIDKAEEVAPWAPSTRTPRSILTTLTRISTSAWRRTLPRDEDDEAALRGGERLRRDRGKRKGKPRNLEQGSSPRARGKDVRPCCIANHLDRFRCRADCSRSPARRTRSRRECAAAAYHLWKKIELLFFS